MSESLHSQAESESSNDNIEYNLDINIRVGLPKSVLRSLSN